MDGIRSKIGSGETFNNPETSEGMGMSMNFLEASPAQQGRGNYQPLPADRTNEPIA